MGVIAREPARRVRVVPRRRPDAEPRAGALREVQPDRRADPAFPRRRRLDQLPDARPVEGPAPFAPHRPQRHVLRERHRQRREFGVTVAPQRGHHRRVAQTFRQRFKFVLRDVEPDESSHVADVLGDRRQQVTLRAELLQGLEFRDAVGQFRDLVAVDVDDSEHVRASDGLRQRLQFVARKGELLEVLAVADGIREFPDPVTREHQVTEPPAVADGVGDGTDQVTVRPEALEALASADAPRDLRQPVARQTEPLQLAQVADVVGDARDLVVAELEIREVRHGPDLVRDLGEADAGEVQAAAPAPGFVDARDDLARGDGQALQARVVQLGRRFPGVDELLGFVVPEHCLARRRLVGGWRGRRRGLVTSRLLSLNGRRGAHLGHRLREAGGRGLVGRPHHARRRIDPNPLTLPHMSSPSQRPRGGRPPGP